MTTESLEAQNPLILRCHRLMEAFAKSDDERDFYIDRLEGFLIYVDLDKSQTELDLLEEEMKKHPQRFCQIPKLSFYETKKIMEGFVNEKVYDIDTKEKLLDIIQSKEARENFLEFIFDHHSEQEKWQQYYQERSRIRIIEWLRSNHFHFVFEEDLELTKQMSEKIKQSLFQPKVSKEILAARKMLSTKAKTYYSSEALNPRPKRGRPPKQAVKTDIEPQVTIDIYTTVPPALRTFLFTPDINQSLGFSAFSSKFGEEDVLQKKVLFGASDGANLSQKISSLRSLSNSWTEQEKQQEKSAAYSIEPGFDEEEEEEEEKAPVKKVKRSKPAATKKKAKNKSAEKEASPKLKSIMKKEGKTKTPAKKRIMPKIASPKKKKSE